MKFEYEYSNTNGKSKEKFKVDGKEVDKKEYIKQGGEIGRISGLIRPFKVNDQVKNDSIKIKLGNFIEKNAKTNQVDFSKFKWGKYEESGERSKLLDFINSSLDTSKNNSKEKENVENKKDTNTKENKKYNIYEIRTLLKKMPKDTKAIMHINGDEKYVVKLNYKNSFVCEIDEDIWVDVFRNFNNDEILFALFELKQQKEEWVDCDIETAIDMFENGYPIRGLDDVDKAIYYFNPDTPIDTNRLYVKLINKLIWQYFK